MAIRYDQNQKDEVVAFIVDYNAKNGRGGQSAAAAKYKLNPITVKAWMEKAGVPSPNKKSKDLMKKKKMKKKGAAASKASAPKAAKSSPSKAGSPSASEVTKSLNKMVAIREQIDALEAEYAALKASL